jgi:predicted DNA-binding transcriptional regulator AlpA
VDVERAADLYAQGWTLRQIGAELGLTASTVSDQLRRAGVTMRRGAPAHRASTQQIVELRDQDLSWTEVAEKVAMTRSGAWSRYQRSRPPKPARLGRWQQVLGGLAIGLFVLLRRRRNQSA